MAAVLPGDEVTLDTLLRESMDATEALMLSPRLRLILAIIVVDLDPTVVGHSSAIALLDRRCILDLAVTMRWG